MRHWIGLLILLSTGWISVSSAAPGDPACAKSYITLRKGPGSKHPVSWRVARFMPFVKMESKDSWVKVQDLDGETHWAQARDLTTSYSCVVVRSQIATLRKEPSTSAEPLELRTADKFTPFKKIEVDGEWVKIEDEAGRQGWVHHSTVWRPVKVLGVNF